MRLAAQCKGGFYPADSAAITAACKPLRAPSGKWSLLDPCAGKGAALLQLAEELGCDQSGLHAIELDEGRANDLHVSYTRLGLDKAKVLAPASMLGCSVSQGGFSMIWLNPPFDDEIGGGGRVETAFLRKATWWLKAGGILCLVCPEHVATNWTVREILMQWYDCISIEPFPESVRNYHEVVVYAVKRKTPVKPTDVHWHAIQAPAGTIYRIPESNGPVNFEKSMLTELEMYRALCDSPLQRLFQPPKDLPLASPPLALGAGHRALLLASGQLDGVVAPDGEKPHVVRGTPKKVTYVKSESVNEDDDGNVSTTTVYGERITMIVRVAEQDGTLTTLTEEGGSHENC